MLRKSPLLLACLLISGMFLYAQTIKQKDVEKKSAKIIGFLVDVHCATGLDEKDRKHPVSCALQPNCAKSGYAVVSKDIVYKLDESGNKLALEILKNTKTKIGMAVSIEGTVKEGTLFVDTISEVPKPEI